MKANDFRLGNIINHQEYKSIFQGVITSISPYRVGIDNHTSIKLNSENLIPIPLTEEWLFKFGFMEVASSILLPSFMANISWSNADFKVISVCPEKGNQYIYLRHGEKNAPRENDDIICVFNGDVNGTLYVHTLQNLYFALTGQELTL